MAHVAVSDDPSPQALVGASDTPRLGRRNSTRGGTMPDRRQAADSTLGERIRAVEVKLDAVEDALRKGEEGFGKLRETLDSVKQMIQETHADCLKAKDLIEVERRMRALERFASKTMKWGGIGSVIFGAVLTVLTLFGPNRVAEAWVQLWK